jgi:cation diffusion facilitator CzcD-associated flavoprotein CzcO
MPHFFGVKRPCLEQNYYEQFNRPNVDIIDIKNNPIAEFTETGIKLEDGSHEEFDVIAIATGFVRLSNYTKICNAANNQHRILQPVV